MFSLESLSTSDIIEIISIVASLITSLVAILISIKTLAQNSKMIEESTRPYVVIYSRTTNFQSPDYYLVIKNFGQTGAVVTSIRCDFDLSLFSFKKDLIPFKHFSGTFLAPGQSFLCNLNTRKLFQNDPPEFRFYVEYKTGRKKYSDYFTINPKADADLIQTRAATKGQELRNISYTLQDLVEKQL